MTPLDDKCQNVQSKFLTFFIFAKVWTVHKKVTETDKLMAMGEILQICLKMKPFHELKRTEWSIRNPENSRFENLIKFRVDYMVLHIQEKVNAAIRNWWNIHRGRFYWLVNLTSNPTFRFLIDHTRSYFSIHRWHKFC